MIQAIKPAAYEAENRFGRWDREEDERFSRSMAKAKTRLPKMPDMSEPGNSNIELPAFNILTGTTNYALRTMASDRRVDASQMVLFERRSDFVKA